MKRRNIILIIAVVLVVGIGAFLLIFNLKNRDSEENDPKVMVKELDTIDEYGYKLEDRDTELYKTNFEALRDELKKEEVTMEEYAKLISKLYIIDLYNIDNKINQYDVGGLDFVSPDARENFDKKVKDTIYKYVEDNTYSKRTQELPKVKSVEVDEITEEKQKVGETEFDGFSVKISWNYEKDLGYDKSATLKLIRSDKFIYVIKQSVSE